VSVVGFVVVFAVCFIFIIIIIIIIIITIIILSSVFIINNNNNNNNNTVWQLWPTNHVQQRFFVSVCRWQFSAATPSAWRGHFGARTIEQGLLLLLVVYFFRYNKNNNNKITKYCNHPPAYMFQPIEMETLAAINSSADEFLADLGRKISSVSGETREGIFSFSAAFHSFAAIQRDPTAWEFLRGRWTEQVVIPAAFINLLCLISLP